MERVPNRSKTEIYAAHRTESLNTIARNENLLKKHCNILRLPTQLSKNIYSSLFSVVLFPRRSSHHPIHHTHIVHIHTYHSSKSIHPTQFTMIMRAEVRQEAVQQALAALKNRPKPSLPMPSKRSSVLNRSPDRDRDDSGRFIQFISGSWFILDLSVFGTHSAQSPRSTQPWHISKMRVQMCDVFWF